MRVLKSTALLLVIVILAGCLFGCRKPTPPSEDNPLLGVWKDTYDLTEYEFLNEHQLRLTTIGIASFDGTYEINDGQMTISLSMFGTEEKKTYQYRFEEDCFFLNDTEFVRKGAT